MFTKMHSTFKGNRTQILSCKAFLFNALFLFAIAVLHHKPTVCPTLGVGGLFCFNFRHLEIPPRKWTQSRLEGSNESKTCKA